jgi:hypothetical protein
MNLLKFVILSVFLFSCGGGEDGLGLKKLSPIGSPDMNNFVSVAQVSIKMGKGGKVLQAKASKNFMSAFASLDSSLDISYSFSANGTMLISQASLPNPDSAVLPLYVDFGVIDVTSFDSNNLNVCGASSNQKCTKTVFRAYLNDQTGNGKQIKIGSNVLQLGIANAVNISEIANIPFNRNRIRHFPAPQNPFTQNLSDLGDLVLDLSNAGAGDYEAEVVIELALGI